MSALSCGYLDVVSLGGEVSVLFVLRRGEVPVWRVSVDGREFAPLLRVAEGSEWNGELRRDVPRGVLLAAQRDVLARAQELVQAANRLGELALLAPDVPLTEEKA